MENLIKQNGETLVYIALHTVRYTGRYGNSEVLS